MTTFKRPTHILEVLRVNAAFQEHYPPKAKSSPETNDVCHTLNKTQHTKPGLQSKFNWKGPRAPGCCVVLPGLWLFLVTVFGVLKNLRITTFFKPSKWSLGRYVSIATAFSFPFSVYTHYRVLLVDAALQIQYPAKAQSSLETTDLRHTLTHYLLFPFLFPPTPPAASKANSNGKAWRLRAVV